MRLLVLLSRYDQNPAQCNKQEFTTNAAGNQCLPKGFVNVFAVPTLIPLVTSSTTILLGNRTDGVVAPAAVSMPMTCITKVSVYCNQNKVFCQ